AAARGSLGATGAILLFLTLLVLAIPLSTQVSLAEVALALRMRFAGLSSRLMVGWARQRDRRTKERLRRTVVTKHLEKARKEGIPRDEVPSTRDEGPPVLREVPGPGRFSITRTKIAVPREAPAPPAASAPPARKKSDAQRSLPLTIAGYTY